MRSRTGCLTCRQRKLKCGEEKPTCANCIKASRECIPSSGITFRHQQNASLNGGNDEADADAPLGKYYSYKNTFDSQSIWVDIPRNIRFIHTDNPYEDPLSPEIDLSNASPHRSTGSLREQAQTDGPAWISPTAEAAMPVQPFSSTPIISTFTNTSPPGVDTASPISRLNDTPRSLIRDFGPLQPSRLSTDSLHSPNAVPNIVTTPSANNNLSFILNHPLSLGSPSEERALPPQPIETCRGGKRKRTSAEYPSVNQRLSISAESDHEVAFLLRYFSEGPGNWMDLFDLGLYFSNYVPIKALLHPLLKYSAAALAAKALGRVGGKKPVYGGNKSRLGRTERLHFHHIDWHRKAAEYYDVAIGLLRAKISEEGESPIERQRRESFVDGSLDMHSAKRMRFNEIEASCPHAVELLVATAILSVYEFLDASNPEWSQHLNGAKSLLDIAKESMVPFSNLPDAAIFSNANQHPTLRARKATFWVIARQDMLAALITDTHTRINTEDHDLWREAGLLIDENGLLLPSSDDMVGSTREDLISNGLVWLQMKLVNFMAAGDDLPAEIGGSPWAGVPQKQLLDYWYYLEKQFQDWFETLPKTFTACARVAPVPSSPLSPDDNDDVPSLPEIWYSMPMCASAMQHYLMSQILLSINKPHESTQGRTTVSDRYGSYETVVKDCRMHAQEIVSICLARDQDVTRVHSVQPLFFAGQCLQDRHVRSVCLTLLREIEADVGWATEYRCKQLLQQWGVEEAGLFTTL